MSRKNQIIVKFKNPYDTHEQENGQTQGSMLQRMHRVMFKIKTRVATHEQGHAQISRAIDSIAEPENQNPYEIISFKAL